jgi:hypothetical protein
MDELVECHSGSEYAERPTSLYWQGERLEVSEVINRWRTPDGIVFRVNTITDQQFELFYNEGFDEWRITLIYETNKEKP